MIKNRNENGQHSNGDLNRGDRINGSNAEKEKRGLAIYGVAMHEN